MSGHRRFPVHGHRKSAGGKTTRALAAVCEETRDNNKIRGALDELSQALRPDLKVSLQNTT